MECLRVRKLNPSFTKELEEVNALIVRIYQTIKQERDDNERQGTPGNSRYYDRLLESEPSEGEDKKESFTKRLLDQ